MKTFQLYLIAGLLAVSPAVAGAIPPVENGVLPGSPPNVEARNVEARTGGSGCNADNVLRALRNPTRSVGASAFCSTFLRSTVSETTTVAKPTTITETATSTTTTTSTTSSTVVAATASALCPAGPTPGQTCGFEAYGFSSVLISQTPNTDGFMCHEMCLRNPNCRSFQVQTGGARFCNLFTAPTAGNVSPAPGGGFTFYDRNCPDFLPPACSAPARKMKRDEPIPPYLATVPPTRISSACSCFITSPAAPVTVVSTVESATTTTTTSTTITTTTSTSTTLSSVTTTSVSRAAP
ncbi:MAG: hypothetical protein M1817_000012 [Caeruleum heppii]|nr:MAG: hypothetical protein M1817_000012 [Caeruleum heppii]